MEGADAPERSEMKIAETHRVWLSAFADGRSIPKIKVVLMDGQVRLCRGWPDGWGKVFSIEVEGYPLSLTYYPDLGE
jgi:hypothetical protein